MKKGQRRKAHHHHRLHALLIQYAHLTDEEKAEAMEADILEIASMLDGAQAARVLDKIREKFRVHR